MKITNRTAVKLNEFTKSKQKRITENKVNISSRKKLLQVMRKQNTTAK